MGLNRKELKSRRFANDGWPDKAPTGIIGFDEMTSVGLPHGLEQSFIS
jgi:hypothetical protein